MNDKHISVKKISEDVLKVLYEFYREEDPNDLVPLINLETRLDHSVKDINGALAYLKDKNLISEGELDENTMRNFRITPEGIDSIETPFIESKEPPSIVLNDVSGPVNIYQPHQPNHHYEDYATGNNILTGKEFVPHYKAVINLIQEFRDLLVSLTESDSIAPEVEEQFQSQCNAVEAIIRSRAFHIEDV